MTVPVTTHAIETNEQRAVPGTQGGPVHVLESKDLFKGSTEILIRHEDAVYRMKITRQGKLILNK